MWQRETQRPDHRPHLLIESDDPAIALADFTAFTDAGFDVVVCGGPSTNRPCPLVTGHSCPLVDRASVVFFGLDFTRPEIRAVLDAIRASYPDVPIVVETRSADAVGDLPHGVVVLPSSTSVAGRCRVFQHAVAGQRPR